MARTVEEIKAQAIAAKEADPNLTGLSSDSMVALWNLLFYIPALMIQLFEQILDIFKVDIEKTVENNYVGTEKWIRLKSLEFQYSSTVPQILEINPDTYKISYPVVDPSLRIISRVTAETDFNKVVNIKVAKNEPPVQLAGPEETAYKDYLKELQPAGVEYNVINAVSDKLYLEMEVFYNGQYIAVIQDNVEAAINAYLAGIDFNGKIQVIEIEKAIKAVAGVVDLKVKNIWLRANAIPLVNAFKLVDNFAVVLISAVPYSGYSIEETTASNTWGDKITYTIM
jgi:hypothetical protein